jgi:hypothetical protein
LLDPGSLLAENNSVMFCVGNFANLIKFNSILKEVAHIWAFTCRLFCGGVSQGGEEIEYMTKR